MMKTAVFYWFAIVAGALAAQSHQSPNVRVARNLAPTTSCDYDWLAVEGDLCWGDSQNPWDQTHIARVYTVEHPTVEPGASGDEYCQDYCDTDPSCLGYVVAVEQSSSDWIQCHISLETPTRVYSDGAGDTMKCWRKIEGSCQVQSSTKPTMAPILLPRPAIKQSTDDLDASCNACVDAGCTWCEASEHFDDDPSDSLCVCEGLTDGFFGGCNDFLFGSDPKTKCGKTLGDRLANVPFPVWIFIGWFIVTVCCLVFMVKYCRAEQGGATGVAGTANDTNQTDPSRWYFTNAPGVESHGEMPPAMADIFEKMTSDLQSNGNFAFGGTHIHTSSGTSNFAGRGTSNSTSNDFGGSSFSTSNDFGGTSSGCSDNFGSSGGGGGGCGDSSYD